MRVKVKQKFRDVKVSDDGTIHGERKSEFHTGLHPFWYRFSASYRLLHIQLVIDASERALRQIWELQDGMPCLSLAHYDWSAIRDSSPDAVEEMYKVAQRYLPTYAFEKALGLRRGDQIPPGGFDDFGGDRPRGFGGDWDDEDEDE